MSRWYTWEIRNTQTCRVACTYARIWDISRQVIQRIQQNVEASFHVRIIQRGRMQAGQETRNEFSFPGMLVQADRDALLDHIRVKFPTLKFFYRLNDLIRIARIEIFMQALFQLELEFRQGQHGTENLLSVRLVKSQSDRIFMTSQNIRRFFLIVERIPFVQGFVRLKSDKYIVLPLPLAVTSLLLGPRIKIARFSWIRLFASNVAFGSALLDFGFMISIATIADLNDCFDWRSVLVFQKLGLHLLGYDSDALPGRVVDLTLVDSMGYGSSEAVADSRNMCESERGE